MGKSRKETVTTHAWTIIGPNGKPEQWGWCIATTMHAAMVIGAKKWECNVGDVLAYYRYSMQIEK